MVAQRLLLAGLVAVAEAVPAEPAKPNVLLMLCDDLRPWMPFYGDEMGVKAPNLAKLAAEGMAFNNSYCQQAICSPTRNSFMTGRRPDSTRIWNFQGSFRDVGLDKSGKHGKDWQTLPEAFKVAGYTTTGLGKTFHPGSPKNWDQPRSWSPEYPYYDPDEQIASFHTLIPVGEQKYPAIEAATGDCVPKNCAGFVCHDHDNWTTTCNLPEQNTTDYITAARAVSQLTEIGGKANPFFFAVGFHKPHPNWPIPMRLQDMYKDLPLTTSKHAPVGMPPEAFISCDFLQDHDDVKAAVLDGQGILPNTSLPDVLAHKIRAGYAAGITWMDEQAGKVLDTLERVGHKDDTIVLFTAE
jgi:iduronate 2-sulfatase